MLGSIGVRLPSVRPSALLVTHSVLRSHDGTTCCGFDPDRGTVDDLHGRGVDDVDVVGLEVRHVHPGSAVFDRRAEHAGTGIAVQVVRVRDRRHAGDRVDFLGLRR